jgi:glycogen debranching enzyme
MTSTDRPLPSFDIDDIPFSRRGSWLDLSRVVGLHRRAEDIHLVSHVTGMHAVARLVPVRGGERVASEVTADPAVLTWRVEGVDAVRAAFAPDDVVRITGTGVDLRIDDAADGLTPFTGSYLFHDPMDGAFTFTSYETGRRCRVTVLRGAATATGAGALGEHERSVTVSGGDGWEIAVEQFETSRAPYRAAVAFDEVAAASADDVWAFRDAIAPWGDEDAPATTLAASVLWSAAVAPAGFLGRESVLMSKHWMDKVWSWDHAFNALALAPGLPDLALDQFLVPFDHQESSGALPDSVTHSEVLYNFVKPPIHGWAFRELRSRLARPLTDGELLDVYDRLSRWCGFWLDHRTAPGSDLPHYQHGNDSGWDNATTFDDDRVIESPDLAVFLAVQVDAVADLAEELDLDGADEWRGHRDRLLTAVMDRLSDDDGFFARGALTGVRSGGRSLLTLLPVLGADLLPSSLVAALASGVRRHLTEWGLATEPVDSPDYESDGYWRGPIWAPSTLLVERGLRAAGETELADEVADRFLALCERSGFAENFDAVTGEGLRDRAYTWTASVYLVLARDRVERRGA